MKYFEIKNGKVTVIKGKRPTNQSDPKVLNKIASRLEKLIDNNPDMKLTELQELFVKKIREDGEIALQDNKIDIAHNLAISAIKDAIAYRANNPLSAAEYEALVDQIISTEEEDDKEFVKSFFQGLLDPSIKLEEKMKEADTVVERLNRASKNLTPGYSSTNRSVSKYRDPHLVKKNDGFVETPISVSLSKSFNKLLIDSTHDPKIRKTPDGKKEYQSSSISNTPKDSWYSPTRK